MPQRSVQVVAATCVALLIAGAVIRAQTKTAKPSARPSTAGFAVEIEQHGTIAHHVTHEMRLKRAPFTIVLHSPDLDGAYLNVSFNPELFNLGRMGLPFGNLLRSGLTVAEEHLNPEHALYEGLAIHYLDYTDKTYVRMDQVTPVGAGFRGRRTVEKIYVEEPHSVAEVARSR